MDSDRWLFVGGLQCERSLSASSNVAGRLYFLSGSRKASFAAIGSHSSFLWTARRPPSAPLSFWRIARSTGTLERTSLQSVERDDLT